MDNEQLTQDTLDWLEAIEIDPPAWANGVLEAMLDMECVSAADKSIILRRYQALTN